MLIWGGEIQPFGGSGNGLRGNDGCVVGGAGGFFSPSRPSTHLRLAHDIQLGNEDGPGLDGEGEK
jgi:hypothetical protein